ncbi:MAG: hypothetical protein HPY83_06900 [Anaerolineae bacterium]|nr:hypothetical protein [Anaerolineae bacterium]
MQALTQFPLFLLSNYVMRLPLLLLWLIAVIIALARWRQMPRVAPLVMLGLLIALLDAVVGGIVSTWLPMSLAQTAGPQRLALLTSVLTLVRSSVQAVAWGLVLWAAFSDR